MTRIKLEWHIINTTRCPVCKARVGDLCTWFGRIHPGQEAGLVVYSARRAAWQAAGSPEVGLA
jgi:hypothetical protein